MATVLDHALGYEAAGLSVIRVRANGTKAPLDEGWRAAARERTTRAQIERLFNPDIVCGVGIVGGPASGNLAVLDFEVWDAYTRWLRSLPPALQQLTRPCPLVRTAGGGAHLYVRLTDPVKGCVLAHRLVEGKAKILIEVRADGEQVVAPGSPPQCHKSGNLYEWARRGWLDAAVPCVPVDLHDWFALMLAAEALNEVPRKPREPRPDTRDRARPTGKRPGDDFNERGTWEETGLFAAGWTWHRSEGDDRGFVTRPGKGDGVSGSLGMVLSKETGCELFYCFTSNGSPFEHKQSYSRFRVYAMLQHDGDWRTAARELGKKGYGAPARTGADYSKNYSTNHPNPERTASSDAPGDPPSAYSADFGDGEPGEALSAEPGSDADRTASSDGPNSPAGPNPPPANGAKPPLPVVYYDEIRPVLDAADFVEGLLIDGTMSVIYGESNCGKTFFALDLALHVAVGMPWRGRQVEQRGVLYLAMEGKFGVSNRVAAFMRDQLAGAAPVPFAVVPVALDLLSPDGDLVRVIEAARVAAERLGVPVGLIVVDTLSRAIAGGNENSPEDMGALVRNLDVIRQALPAHLAVVHHSGKDAAKGARGHSLLRAATDTEIEVTRDPVSKVSTARVTKQRDLEIAGDFPFRLQVVELGLDRREKPVTSCVVRPVDADGLPTKEQRKEQEERAKKARERERNRLDEEAVLLVIDAEASHGLPGASLSWIGDHVDFGDDRAKAAVNRLVERGELVKVPEFQKPTANNGYRPVRNGFGRPKSEQEAA